MRTTSSTGHETVNTSECQYKVLTSHVAQATLSSSGSCRLLMRSNRPCAPSTKSYLEVPHPYGTWCPATKGPESMTIRRKALGLTAVAVAAALALTACSATGGKKAAESAAAAAAGTGAPASGGGAVADTPRFTIAMVTHEAPGDSFWDKVRAGAQVAAAKDNIDLKYSNDPTGPGEATLVQNAVDSKVDGIAVTLL